MHEPGTVATKKNLRNSAQFSFGDNSCSQNSRNLHFPVTNQWSLSVFVDKGRQGCQDKHFTQMSNPFSYSML